MIKEINGYKVRVSSKEGMKYIKVSKENRISQEFIPNFMKEKEIKEIVKRLVEEVDSIELLSEKEIEDSKRAERGFYQVLAEDYDIVFDKKVFYKYAIKQKRIDKTLKKTQILCPPELRKEIERELNEEEAAEKAKKKTKVDIS